MVTGLIGHPISSLGIDVSRFDIRDFEARRPLTKPVLLSTTAIATEQQAKYLHPQRREGELLSFS
jgi:hypothetical protein